MEKLEMKDRIIGVLLILLVFSMMVSVWMVARKHEAKLVDSLVTSNSNLVAQNQALGNLKLNTERFFSQNGNPQLNGYLRQLGYEVTNPVPPAPVEEN